MAHQDSAKWHARWWVNKYTENIRDWEAKYGEAEGQRRFYAECKPYETLEREGNLLVNAGIQLMEDLLIGAGGTVFSNANARIAVGDSATAAAASQTDLQASTNKFRRVMEATYPSRAGQTVSFKSSYATGEANYAWQEWAIANSASGATILNRKVESLGTKTSGTWTLEVAVSIT